MQVSQLFVPGLRHRDSPGPVQVSAVTCLEGYHLRQFKQKIVQIKGIQKIFCNSRKASRLFPNHVLTSQTFHLENPFIVEKRKQDRFCLCFGKLSVIVTEIIDVDYTESGSCKEFLVKTLKSCRPQDHKAVFKKW